MKNLGITVVFFGNGPVAAASLQGFVDTFGTDAIEIVITKVKPAHHKEHAPVEVLAESLGLPLGFANTKQELDTLIADKIPSSPLGLVIDYGVIMSATAIKHFSKGIVNSHFSLLPEWRGADPITYSLLSGQSKTGISLMLIDEGLDTGPLLSYADLDLDGTETNQTLTDALIELSDASIRDVLPLYVNGEIQAAEQNVVHSLPGEYGDNHTAHVAFATFSRKLTKQDGILVFTKTATELEREVRAFSSWPKSRTTIAGIDCVITKSAVSTQLLTVAETIVTQNKTILIGCRIGSLEILELQPAGKNKMPTAAFLNGYGHLL